MYLLVNYRIKITGIFRKIVVLYIGYGAVILFAQALI